MHHSPKFARSIPLSVLLYLTAPLLLSAVGVGSQSAIAIATDPPTLSPATLFTLNSSTSPSESLRIAQLPDAGRTRTPDPNRDRLLQPEPLPIPLPTAPSVLPLPSPTPTPAPALEQPVIEISVERIDITGSTIFTQKDFEPVLEPVEGREVTLEELQQVVDGITQLYLDRGYITSRAFLVDQTVEDGVVQIRVIEGSLEEIQVQGNRSVSSAYIRSRIGLGVQTPLNGDALEDQLRLLKLDPLFTSVEASLRPGTQLGTSILIVRVTEAESLNGSISVDNYSPPSVGSVRLGGALSYRNLTGYGDELFVSFFHTTTSGAENLDLIYRIPVNPMNGSLQFRFAPNWNQVTQSPFNQLFDIEGQSQLYQFSFRQPLLRNPRQEFALTLGFASQNNQTYLFNRPFPFSFGSDPNGESRTRVLSFGQDYVKRDTQGAWALLSQLNFGLDILDATVNPSPIPDGRFFSWLAQVQRVQRLGNNNLLLLQGDLQLTPDTLLPSQQFVIGGGQSVRGYAQNARSGDNGFRVSVEDRIALLRDEDGFPIVQLAPFVDLGQVWNTSGNPNPEPEQTFLIGAGLGLLWQPLTGLNIRVDYGHPFVQLRNRGNDAQDYGFYFSVNYQF